MLPCFLHAKIFSASEYNYYPLRNVIEKVYVWSTCFVQACASAEMLAQPIQIGDVM